MALAACRLCLSGVESRRLLETMKDFDIPFVQLSYYYMRKVFGSPKDANEYLKHFQYVVIDHGLHYHNYKTEAEKQQFLEDYQEYVSNLDPKVYQAVVSHTSLQLDKDLDSAKLIYPLEDLENLFENDIKSIFSQIEYIGISNKVSTDDERMGYITSQAVRSGAKLHAFGTSSIKVLKRWPFYSANSSSWRTGSRYANTYIYEGATRGLRIYQPTNKTDLDKTDIEKRTIRKRLENMILSRQPELLQKIDWTALYEDDSWEVDKANLTQWILYQKDLELDCVKSYWLTDAEKATLLGTSNTGGAITERVEDPDNVEILTPRKEQQYLPEAQSEVVRYPGIIEGGEGGALKSYRITPLDTRITTPRKCDFCILANRCPKYQPGAPCAFGLTDSYLPSDLEDHIQEDTADILAMQKDRILQGYLEEKTDASGLNKDLSREIRLYNEIVAMKREGESTSISFKAKSPSTGLLSMFSKKAP